MRFSDSASPLFDLVKPLHVCGSIPVCVICSSKANGDMISTLLCVAYVIMEF